MDGRRRSLLAALALAPLAARAQQPASGTDYSVLRPEMPVETQGKIEIIEFFWYGCPSCYRLEPLLEAWVPKLPPDAQFRRIPAVFDDPRWQRDALIYYTFEALGVTAKLHRPLFDAIHRSRLRTEDKPALAEWLQRNDVDLKRFDEASASFGVQSRVRRAAQLSASYRLEGVPTLAVHGRYTIKVEQAKSYEGMLATADHLIGLARKTLAATK